MTPDKIIKKESEKITDAANKFINALKKQGIAMNKISWDMTSITGEIYSVTILIEKK